MYFIYFIALNAEFSLNVHLCALSKFHANRNEIDLMNWRSLFNNNRTNQSHKNYHKSVQFHSTWYDFDYMCFNVARHRLKEYENVNVNCCLKIENVNPHIHSWNEKDRHVVHLKMWSICRLNSVRYMWSCVSSHLSEQQQEEEKVWSLQQIG